MGSYDDVYAGIMAFIKRYYTRKTLRGLILFTSIEVVILLLIGFLEYGFWLPSEGRLALLMVGGLQLILAAYYLIFNNMCVFIHSKYRITPWEASKKIGSFFPEIKDRLTNLIELDRSPIKSDLILAGIAQRSDELKGFPLYAAVRYSELWSPAKRLLIPFLILSGVVLGGKTSDITAAFKRIIAFNQAFEKPAPFHFNLITENLQLFENQTFTIKVGIEGPVRPKEVSLLINDEVLIMEDRKGHFETTLLPPLTSGSFIFSANGIQSQSYTLEVVPVPQIQRFELRLLYPTYLKKSSASLIGSGNAVVPEGTKLIWNIHTAHTDSVYFTENQAFIPFVDYKNGHFKHHTTALTSFKYSVSTSNTYTKNYNHLDYTIDVVPDAYPSIDVNEEEIAHLENRYTFSGTVSDDYGISELSAVLRHQEDSTNVQEVSLGNFNSVIADFNYSFPDGFIWNEPGNYMLYFKIKDNDGLHGSKTTISESFIISKVSEEELQNRRFEQQQALLTKLKNASTAGQTLQKEWKKQLRINKESTELGFDERKAIRNLFERQQQQEEMMNSFSKELNKSFNDNPEEKKEDQLLLERLERQEIEAAKNAQILSELKEVMDKLDQEEFKERMEEFTKAQSQNQRSLEQILELTKKYFVNQTARQLSQKLNDLGDLQNILSTVDPSDELAKQDSIRQAFKEVQQSLKELEIKNQELKKPINWKRDKPKEESVNSDLNKALEKLKTAGPTESNSPSSDVQSGAAGKMKELANQLSSGSGASATASQRSEDAESLRQILENLIDFSLEQESILGLSGSEQNLRSGIILKQQELRVLFEHIDDSLFTLSLRQPAISETINKNITEIYYNLDKSLGLLSENQWNQSNSYQQYTLSGSNELASILAKILDNLQESLKPGNGKGGSSNFQLPDIIQSQGKLQQQLSNQGRGKSEASEQGQKSTESGARMEGAKEKPSTNGNSEIEMEELYNIYKEQTRIRNQLEKQLEQINSELERAKTNNILKEMEHLENSILNTGINASVLQQINQIQNELLKLEVALLQQGEGDVRKSDTNTTIFKSNISKTTLDTLENAAPQIEILNRQPLPLRLKFKDKVKIYFSKDD